MRLWLRPQAFAGKSGWELRGRSTPLVEEGHGPGRHLVGDEFVGFADDGPVIAFHESIDLGIVAGDSGLIELRTIKPAAYPVPDTAGWWRPPHIHFSVWGRIWLSRLVTQMFFPGEPLNDSDAILNAIRDPEARRRCIAQLAPTTKGPQDALVYEYQIVVRGRSSTPKLS